jgi:hypothetical protein
VGGYINYKEGSLPRPNALNIILFPIKKCLESPSVQLPLLCDPNSSLYSPLRPGVSAKTNYLPKTINIVFRTAQPLGNTFNVYVDNKPVQVSSYLIIFKYLPHFCS